MFVTELNPDTLNSSRINAAPTLGRGGGGTGRVRYNWDRVVIFLIFYIKRKKMPFFFKVNKSNSACESADVHL